MVVVVVVGRGGSVGWKGVIRRVRRWEKGMNRGGKMMETEQTEKQC